MIWISAGILVAQIVIGVVSYITLHRHRVVYGLRTEVLRLPDGSRDDVYINTEHITEKLNSEKYTVLQIVPRPNNTDLEVILGQIKKIRTKK